MIERDPGVGPTLTTDDVVGFSAALRNLVTNPDDDVVDGASGAELIDQIRSLEELKSAADTEADTGAVLPAGGKLP